MPAVKTCPLDPLAFAREFETAALARGFERSPLAEVDGVPLAAYRRCAAPGRPTIYLSSGIHGDEPAPPRALLRLLETDTFDPRASWYLVPLLNPTGYRGGVRENLQGVDLNRDYLSRRSTEIAAHIAWLERQPPFDVTFCLHEDWESQGFYLYELNPDHLPSLAPAMIAAAAALGPIETAPVIDGRPAHGPGLIRPVSDPLLREQWPEAIYLHARHTRLSYTLETASAQPLGQRVATTQAAVTAALAEFLARPTEVTQ